MHRFVVVLVAILCAPTLCPARTWHILPDGTGDAPTIQAGVDSAAFGDTVEVACGTYFEQEVTLTSGLTLRSESGLAGCATLDGQSAARLLVATGITDVVVDGLVFRNAYGLGQGGAVAIEDSQLEFTDCVFEDCAVEPYHSGGAINAKIASDLSVRRCLFRGNLAYDGGAINNQGHHLFVEDTVFEDNHCQTPAGGGGAISGYGPMTIVGSEFVSNISGQGGAIFVQNSSADVFGCTFRTNEAGVGGAFCLWDAPSDGIHFQDCVFEDNHATWGGGAFNVSSGVMPISSPMFLDCLLIGNTADHDGGAGYVEASSQDDGPVPLVESCTFVGNASGEHGGALWKAGNRPLANCTMIANSAPQGSAVFFWSLGGSFSFHTQINNVLAYGNLGSPALECDAGHSIDIACSDVYGNPEGDWVGCLEPFLGIDGNITSDPLFCAPGVGDYTLRSNSPCAPANSNGCGLIGALPVSCGPVAVEAMSWGKVKGAYR